MPQAMDRLLASPTMRTRFPSKKPICLTCASLFGRQEAETSGSPKILKENLNQSDRALNTAQGGTNGLEAVFRDVFNMPAPSVPIATGFVMSDIDTMPRYPALGPSAFRYGRCGRCVWICLVVSLLGALTACGESPWNSPYGGEEDTGKVFYSSFREPPKHLDPVSSYSSNEYVFISQIYEPPLQYHYLKRPYELVPLNAKRVPVPAYFDAENRPLSADAPDAGIAFSVYEITIRPGIRYQPHPAFARDRNGRYLYHELQPADVRGIRGIGDFPIVETRELVASDYVFQIKRLAHPARHSPIAGLMEKYIVGLHGYGETLKRFYEEARQKGRELVYIDLDRFPLAGAEAVDRYTYRITIKGKYPQFKYWLAMPFFAPVPWEAERFYAQAPLIERNITLDWYPVGTGPFMLTENNPNRRMVLERNPYFHDEFYPSEGAPGDAQAGLLRHAGQRLPLLDRAVYSLEKESIPYWSKFLQGYYDVSGVASDSFDQAVRFGEQGDPEASASMREKGVRLQTAVTTSTYYTGFNMRDAIVGGHSSRARRLRQAVSIAVDFEEYISIFANGRGTAAQGPIPPGIFGHRPGKGGINPHVYDWVGGSPVRKPLSEAKRLLVEAGYPDGRDERTGKPLVLHLDTAITGPDGKARLDWMRKQLGKIDIQLVIRATDYNRFQEKMRQGTAQIFQWGWNADYPDPENFLFLLYGPNAKVSHGGQNAANYANPEVDKLFERMKNMANGLERQTVIDAMVKILHRDAPWLWGYHPKDFFLHHAWYQNSKLNLMANNTLKYLDIDPDARRQRRMEWNQPVLWPVVLSAGVFLGLLIPAIAAVRRRERAVAI